MRRLAKDLILATAVVSVIFFVDLSTAEAANYYYETACSIKKICPLDADTERQYLDFWSKFRDTVMPDPEEPQDNNPPKETEPETDSKPTNEDESKSED